MLPPDYFAINPSTTAGPDQWNLDQCGFTESRLSTLEKSPVREPIAIIDNGDEPRHPELAGRFTYVSLTSGRSTSRHVAEVASIIAAKRDGTGMSGCCSAKVDLYNTWNTDSYNPCALYRSLLAVIQSRSRVLNLSFSLDRSEPAITRLLNFGSEEGLIVIAALGTDPRTGATEFPATHPAVIAVSSSTRADQPFPTKTRSPHVWLAAPGVGVPVVHGSSGSDTGTGSSYAAPHVAAAAWIALQHAQFSPAEMRNDVLRWSVVSDPNVWTDKMGWGRLDMAQLEKTLRRLGVLP